VRHAAGAPRPRRQRNRGNGRCGPASGCGTESCPRWWPQARGPRRTNCRELAGCARALRGPGISAPLPFPAARRAPRRSPCVTGRRARTGPGRRAGLGAAAGSPGAAPPAPHAAPPDPPGRRAMNDLLLGRRRRSRHGDRGAPRGNDSARSCRARGAARRREPRCEAPGMRTRTRPARRPRPRRGSRACARRRRARGARIDRRSPRKRSPPPPLLGRSARRRSGR
jgi:hypothetical protein